MALVFESVADAVGGTPLFRLRGLGRGLAAPVYAKAEFLSVGGSVKDRAALAMIEAAERDGQLRPGGTIVEATSGNTGIGLALIGRQRGYRVQVVIPDTSAQEKVDILRAYGAEVIVGASAVARQHPDHVSNVAQRLADETPGGWLANQYDNPANPAVHVRTTGPEVWEQTGGRVTHFVAGIGTGGTITGTGRFLKQVSGGQVRVIGADPENSVYSGGDGSPYYVESIGHFRHPRTDPDVWPESFDASVVDQFERVGDRESLVTARRLAREDGLLAGPSSGTAVAAALRVAAGLGPSDLVVVLLPDSGRSYLSKLYSDAWMRRWGFLEEPLDDAVTVAEALADNAAGSGPLVTVDQNATITQALAAAAASGAAPAAVLVTAPRTARPDGPAAAEVTGWLSPARLAAALAAGQVRAGDPVGPAAAPPPPAAGSGQSVPAALAALTAAGDGADVLLVVRDGRAHAVVTRENLLRAVRATTADNQLAASAADANVAP